jgi:glyoxylase-like metal-dependent hydrolase (beta-lactamase superfamily II)
MTMRALTWSVAAAALLLAGCSPPAGTVDAAAKALDVAKVNGVTFSGTGTWNWFGQQISPNEAWPPFNLTKFSAAISYTAPAAHVEMERGVDADTARNRPAVKQLADQWVSGASAWNMATPAGGTPTAVAQPGAVAERQAEIWSTPHGFLKAAMANKAVSKPANGGSEVSFTVGDAKYVGTINAKNEVEKVQTWIDNPVLGDAAYETTFSDYKDFGGLRFPAHIVRTIAGNPVIDITVAAAVAAVPDIAVPENVKNFTPPPQKVDVQEVAKGVWWLTGGTHHSLLIEQKDHLVVVEGAPDEARASAVIAKAKEMAPNKPIKYVVNTHSHFDHSGGLRTFVAEGATVVTHEANKAFYTKVWANPHTLNPDALAKANTAPVFETFTDKGVLTDGARTIEIYPIAGNGHSEGFAMVYLPAEKILMEADAFSPAAAPATAAADPVNPYTLNLLENIDRLKLKVDVITPIHGPRTTTVAELRTVTGQPPAK